MKTIDRVSIRARPDGRPVMHHSWGRLLFMHWPLPADRLRPLLPDGLLLDTHEGWAWIGIIPFTMWGIRLHGLPPIPGIRASHELNVRTYVHAGGVPGVLFLSMDASNPLFVWGARLGVNLPYFHARMSLERKGDRIHYASARRSARSGDARFRAAWRIGDPLPPTEPGSLDFFLTERYCLYSRRGDRTYRLRIHHRPWPLRSARLESWTSTLLEPLGLPSPEGAPLLHYADAIDVEVWAPSRI